VTAIETLLRDPYSLYAREILRLRPLDPLTPSPDRMERGTHMHRVLERFIALDLAGEGAFEPATAHAALLARTESVLAEACGWPVMRRLWGSQMARAAGAFLEGEAERRLGSRPHLLEVRGEIEVPGTGVVIVAKADRIDLMPGGEVVILDYKTGPPPTPAQQRHFSKQLLIEAAMAEAGAFGALGPARVAGAAYLGLGAKAPVVRAPLDDLPPALVWAELATLLTAWADPRRGYSARIRIEKDGWEGDHDHLARYGEWDHGTAVTPEDVA